MRGTRIARFAAAWVAIAWVLASTSSAPADVSSRVLAMTGQPTPDGSGQTIRSLQGFNYGIRGGTCVFGGMTANFDYALWGTDADGCLKFSAFDGNAIPGMASQKYSSFDYATISSDGSVMAVVSTRPTDSSLSNRMLLEFRDGSVRALLQNKTTPPGVPGATFYTVSRLGPAYAVNSCFATECQLLGAASGTEFGVWSNAMGTGVQILARKGDPAPGTSGVYDTFDYYPSVAPGIAIFHGYYTQNSMSKFGMWKATSVGVEPVVLEGLTAPGCNGNTFSSASRAILNDAGEFVIKGSMPYVNLQTPISGIFKDTGSGLQCVLNTQSSTPGIPGGRMFIFDQPCIDAQGRVAFSGHLDAFAVHDNTAVLWSEGLTGSLHMVAREGQSVAGLTGQTFNEFSNITMNSVGQVAFLAYLSTSVNALLAEECQGQLNLVAYEGQQISTPAGLRTISSLRFSDSSDGSYAFLNAQSFDEDGTLAYYVTFTDGSNAILTAQVPEPATLCLLAFGSLALLQRRSRVPWSRRLQPRADLGSTPYPARTARITS